MPQQLLSSVIDLKRDAGARASIGLLVHFDTRHDATTLILNRSPGSPFFNVDCAASLVAVKTDRSGRGRRATPAEEGRPAQVPLLPNQRGEVEQKPQD